MFETQRAVDMTSLGKNGLNIRTNASPKWDRTRCPDCWLAAPVAMFYGNLQNLVIRSKSVLKSNSVISSSSLPRFVKIHHDSEEEGQNIKVKRQTIHQR